jgi:hypothetical protein
MNDERLQILKMVQEGKVSPEEAARLLEALEQPDSKNGKGRPKARSLRISVRDGAKSQSIVLNIGMVRWLLRVPGFIALNLTDSRGNRLDLDALADAVDNGAIGKVFEAEDGNHRVEIWIDA